MVEDVARTVHIVAPARHAAADRARSTSTRSSTATRTSTAKPEEPRDSAPARGKREIWFLTGSQHLYGPEVLDQVADAVAPGSPPRSTRRRTCRPGVVTKPVLTDADAIRRALLDATADDACVGVIAWMHTFSPAKMWITGLDALRKPLLHLHTQANQALPWAEIDMDFMNLNQAAHGDREFAAVQTRMGIDPQDRRRPRRRPRGRPPGRRSGPAPRSVAPR